MTKYKVWLNWYTSR